MSQAAEQRRDQMFRRILERGSATVDELAATYGVTAQTVRQDLARLESLGLVTRTRGGAKANLTGEVQVGVKATSHAPEKALMAREALRLVQDGAVVWVDPGSSTLAVARLLALRRNLTVATNSLRAAEAASGGGSRVVLVGGDLEPRALAAGGPSAVRQVSEICVDIAFVGCDGFDGETGPTMTSAPLLGVTRSAMAQAQQTVLLADSSKFSRRGTFRVAPCEVFSCLVTDTLPAEAEWAREAFPQVITPA